MIEENIQQGFTFELANKIKKEIGKAVINYEDNTNMALTTMFSGGHILLEGIPGVAKTLWARSLSRAMNLDFKRTQFTPDLMPADITGTKVYNLQNNTFDLKKGPLFTNIYLADEINRTPPKTQSSLLEVMEEKSITIDGETHVLEEPFFVVATQNPIEFEGTYVLPEALTDRFMMKIMIGYPGVSAEKKMLIMYNSGFQAKNLSTANIENVCGSNDINICREEISRVRVDESILNYIISIIETTRRLGSIYNGASPRASIALLLCAKAYACILGRDYVMPDDIRDLCLPILRHRIILKPEMEMEGLSTDSAIETILNQVKVPR